MSTNVVGVSGNVADGYSATFTVMLDAGSGGTTTPTTGSPLEASIHSLKVIRGGHGSRTIVASLKTSERCTATARLKRGERIIGGAHGQLGSGEHPLPRDGPAPREGRLGDARARPGRRRRQAQDAPAPPPDPAQACARRIAPRLTRISA
jgi:hypothetical protein